MLIIATRIRDFEAIRSDKIAYNLSSVLATASMKTGAKADDKGGLYIEMKGSRRLKLIYSHRGLDNRL